MEKHPFFQREMVSASSCVIDDLFQVRLMFVDQRLRRIVGYGKQTVEFQEHNLTHVFASFPLWNGIIKCPIKSLLM